MEKPETLDAESRFSSLRALAVAIRERVRGWLQEPIPQYLAEAYQGFLGDLPENLAYREAQPEARWVAYRGNQRLGFHYSETLLYNDCLERFPDSRFGVFSVATQPDNANGATVV